jgi:tetratricopeptide (TPR) repeat protein
MAAVTLTYSNHFHNALHFDDSHTIVNNAYLQDIHNIPLFFKDGATSSSLPSNQSYRPFLTTTLAIDYWMGKGLGDTFYFHLTSFLFFLLQGILMFFLFRTILNKVSSDSPSDWIALLAVAWFMLHPVCAETINYIIQRGDSLSTFFVVLAMTLYALSASARKYYLYLIPVVLGILTKPSALIFAPILLCYVLLFEKETGFLSFLGNKNNALVDGAKKTVLAFAICLLGYFFVSKMQPSTYMSGGNSPIMYILSQPFMLFYYFTAWFAPIHLNADTDWVVFASALDPYAILGYLFFGFAIYLMFVTSEYKNTRPIAFGLAWFFLANAPTSLVAFSEVTNDHRMFFPFVGLAIAITWALYLIGRLIVDNVKLPASARYAFFAFLLIMLAGYAYGTHERNKVWKVDESLWKDCAQKSPTNGRGLMNYGLALMNRGDYVGAEKYFSDGLLYWPRYSYLHVNMAILKEATGKKEEAEKYFKYGVEYGGNYPNSYYFYARFLNNNGRKDEAVNLLKKAMEMASAHLDCRYMLMDILYEQKRLEELKQVAQSTVAIAPNDAKAAQYLTLAMSGKSKLDVMKESAKTPEDFLNLSLQYYNAGDYQGCVDAARKSLELRPNYAPAYNNIGSALNILHRYSEAKEALLKAVELDPGSQLAKNNLAVAEAGLKNGGK